MLRLVLIIVVVLLLGSQLASADNLVANGDFSAVTSGKPDNWDTSGNLKQVTQRLDVVTDKGVKCSRLACTRFEGTGPDVHAMVAQVGVVNLEQGKTYQFKCRARAEGLNGRSITVAISDTSVWENCGLYSGLVLGSEWRDYSVVFRATRSVSKTSRLQIWYTETGTLYLADVSITPFVTSQVEFTDTVPASNSKNLLPNSSFEIGGSGWSSLGVTTGWGNYAHLYGNIISSSEPDHASFLRIPLGGGRTPVLYFDYYEPIAMPQTRSLVANRGWIRVEPGADYTLSCDMRASEEGIPAVLGIVGRNPEDSEWSQEYQTQDVVLARTWNRYTYTFKPRWRYVFVNAGSNLKEDKRVDIDIDRVQLEKSDHATAFEPASPMETALEPSSLEGIFTKGESAALALRVRSYLLKDTPVRIDFEVTDYFGKKVKLAPVSMVAKSDTVSLKRIPLPKDWHGYYLVKCMVHCSTPVTMLTPTLRMAFVPKPKSDTFIGINHAFSDDYLVPLASKAGIAWYRDWSLKWEHIQPSPTEWRWDISDTQINRVLKDKVRLMALLPPFPSAEWSSEAPPAAKTTNYPGIRLRQSAAPKDPAKLADFIRSCVAHYKDRINIWEFLNEPIYTSYSLPGREQEGYVGPTYKVADYIRLFKIAADAMRDGDPTCKVIGGMGAGPGDFTQELFDAGFLNVADILNLHIYPGTRAPEAFIPEMESLQRNMDAHGGRKPIWMTEFSYYGVDNLPQVPKVSGGGGWAEERLLQDERQCAEYTVRYMLVMLSHGVEKVFIHSGSSGAVNSPSLECCLFDYGGAPRKIVPALATLTDLLGSNPKCIKSTTQDSLYTATFEMGKSSIAAVWSTGDKPVRIPIPKGSRCLNIVGQELKASSVEASSAPIYLVKIRS